MISNFRREQVRARYQNRCGYCGDKLGVMHVDHIIPYSKGGHSRLENLMPACAQCNLIKRDLDIEGFRQNLETRVNVEISRNTGLRICLRYGLLKVKAKKVKFYFEGVAAT